MKIVNIGSSFSAGPGIPPQAGPKAAHRSGSNFAHLIAKQLDAELVDLSVSGATLLNMLNEPQVVGSTTFPPQVEAMPPDADLVLVLGGGNDMRWMGSMIKDSWLGWAAMSIMALLGFGSDFLAVGEEGVAQRYGALLDAVHAKATKARVVVVEYLTLLGPDTKPGIDVPFGAERLDYYRDMATTLQRVTNQVVSERKEWCEIVHSGKLSEAHGLGSQDPWVFGFGLGLALRGDAWYHLKKSGMEAIADMLREHIGNSQ